MQRQRLRVLAAGKIDATIARCADCQVGLEGHAIGGKQLREKAINIVGTWFDYDLAPFEPELGKGFQLCVCTETCSRRRAETDDLERLAAGSPMSVIGSPAFVKRRTTARSPVAGAGAPNSNPSRKPTSWFGLTRTPAPPVRSSSP